MTSSTKNLPTIKLYNTLTGQKDTFESKVEGKVNLYSCGPTVYDFAHIGNFRSFLLSDLLTRVLKYADREVTKVQNITDVGHLTNDDFADADGEDKIAKKAKAEGIDAFAVAEKFTKYFIEDEAALRIEAPDHRPKATDYIAEQIAMTEQLIAEDFAYPVNGSVYFRTAKFADYGKLSKNKLADLQAGARIEVNDEKESPLDFALWKRADENHLMQWDSPWGRGFPGWHIECSAMSQALLPYTDIHTGGEDNIFPHHECEIAQNECSTHYSIPYWLHGKHLLVDGQKMSKSKGNFFTIRDLMAKGWKGEEIRYALLAGHYRAALNFTEDSLVQARASIKRIQEGYRIFSGVCHSELDSESKGNLSAKFTAALFDDLNVSDALAVVFEMINEGLKQKETGTLSAEKASEMVHFLEEDFNQIFDVLDLDEVSVPDEVAILLQKRQEARENKDWPASDALRDQIRDLGFEVLDEAGGQSVKSL